MAEGDRLREDVTDLARWLRGRVVEHPGLTLLDPISMAEALEVLLSAESLTDEEGAAAEGRHNQLVRSVRCGSPITVLSPSVSFGDRDVAAHGALHPQR